SSSGDIMSLLSSFLDGDWASLFTLSDDGGGTANIADILPPKPFYDCAQDKALAKLKKENEELWAGSMSNCRRYRAYANAPLPADRASLTSTAPEQESTFSLTSSGN